MKRKLLTLISLFALVACGGGNDTKSQGLGNSSSSTIINSSSNVVSTGDKVSSNAQSTSSQISSSSSSFVSEENLTPVPNPEIELYLIGAAVWGWSNYAPMTYYTDNIYRTTLDLKTTNEGFVITSERSFNGMVFHTDKDTNFTVGKYGTYTVYFTFDVTKTDSTWTKATEKTNSKEGYYKIALDSAVEVPIDEAMVFVSGASLSGWGTYLPLFQDEETGYYTYIYGLTTNGEGFIFTSHEDNTHAVYHEDDNTNITVQYAGDYQFLFTYEDMYNDLSWTILKDDNGGQDAYYKLIPLFEIPEIPEPGPTPPVVEKKDPLYIFGAAVGSWENYVELPAGEDEIYTMQINLSTSQEGFVICELSVLSDKTGFCLHDEKGNNFTVAYAGLYELSITWNDMSGDSSWKVAKEVNSNAKGDAYYKLTPLFEIVETEAKVEKIYLNGPNVGGWDSYLELSKVNDNLFEGTVNLAANADGFVITAQKSRGAADIVFKLTNGNNLNIENAGKYTVSLSLVKQDDTWTELSDTKGNYKELVYLKLEEIVETRTNLVNTNTTAEASSTTGKTADKAIDGKLGNDNRWESTQGVDPQWIVIDLKDVYQITGIDIQWYGNAEAKDYTIEVSTDGVNWDVIKTITGGADQKDRLDQFTFEATSARFVKINGTARVKTWGYSINEIYIWGGK